MQSGYCKIAVKKKIEIENQHLGSFFYCLFPDDHI